ncbi:MAG: protocatechuate 3,4-dioxygenase subunit alpha [Acidimicrobiales bacterium]
MTGATPSQTVGPFFSFGMGWMEAGAELVGPGDPGALALHGRVLDGDGAGVPDALVEIWQADAGGRFPGGRFPDGRLRGEGPGPGGPSEPEWSGFGRCLTGADGRYRFTTVQPGRVDSDQAPHIDVSIFARGLLQRLVSRVYFPDEERANRADPVLSGLDDRSRAATLVAVADDGGLRWDVRLQGDDETVFFAW